MVASLVPQPSRLYQIPRRCCTPRLTPAIATQQQNPMKIGLPPVFTSLMRSVFSPIAAMAMTMKNLLASFRKATTAAAAAVARISAAVREINKDKARKRAPAGVRFFI